MMTVKRWVVRRKSDGLYSCSAHGWTPDITLAAFFQDEHLAHLAVDEIKDVIPVLVTLEEMHPYNQQAHRDQVEAMAKAAPPPGDGALRDAELDVGELYGMLREVLALLPGDSIAKETGGALLKRMSDKRIALGSPRDEEGE